MLHFIAILVSKTYFSCFKHIRDLRRIRRYISVVKTIATALIISTLDYCNTLLYNIVYKDITNITVFKTALPRLSYGLLGFPFSPTPEISWFGPCSISQHFQILYLRLSNSFFGNTFVSIRHAFSSTQVPRYRFIWFSLAICAQGWNSCWMSCFFSCCPYSLDSPLWTR